MVVLWYVLLVVFHPFNHRIMLPLFSAVAHWNLIWYTQSTMVLISIKSYVCHMANFISVMYYIRISLCTFFWGGIQIGLLDISFWH